MTLVQKLARYISIPILTVLFIFNLRRILFTLAILFTARKNYRSENPADFPDVLVLVPCRNEDAMIPGLGQAVARLDYPREKLQIVLINDGSTDETGKRIEQQANGRPGWSVLNLTKSIGKASALNSALARFSFGEIIYVLDSDHRPEPDTLVKIVRYFDDPRVAGVTGYTKVINPTGSLSAYYATLESYVNQLVTMRGKDRLGLAPALLGSNCAYRRTALVECGTFRKDAFSEDSDLTVTFNNRGYHTHFAEEVVSWQQVPQTIHGYLKQHIRWGRGLNDVARIHIPEVIRNRDLSVPLRLELLLFMAGYFDRIALIVVGVISFLDLIFKGFSPFPRKWFYFVLVTPSLQILALFFKERFPLAMWVRLPLVPVFYALDVLAAVRSMIDTLLNRSRTWKKTERITG